MVLSFFIFASEAPSPLRSNVTASFRRRIKADSPPINELTQAVVADDGKSGTSCFWVLTAGEQTDSLCFASHDPDSPSHRHGTRSDNLYTSESRKGLFLITETE